MAKLQVAAPVEVAHEARGVEDRMQRCIIHQSATHPLEHFRRAVAIVVPLAMRPMDLKIEIPDPLIMDRHELDPRAGALKVPIRHASHHIKVRLDIAHLALPALDQLVLNAQCCIDRLGLIGLEDCPTIAHERLRAAVLPDRRVAHHQIGGFILCA
jgi:hypothetical protein